MKNFRTEYEKREEFNDKLWTAYKLNNFLSVPSGERIGHTETGKEVTIHDTRTATTPEDFEFIINREYEQADYPASHENFIYWLTGQFETLFMEFESGWRGQTDLETIDTARRFLNYLKGISGSNTGPDQSSTSAKNTREITLLVNTLHSEGIIQERQKEPFRKLIEDNGITDSIQWHDTDWKAVILVEELVKRGWLTLLPDQDAVKFVKKNFIDPNQNNWHLLTDNMTRARKNDVLISKFLNKFAGIPSKK